MVGEQCRELEREIQMKENTSLMHYNNPNTKPPRRGGLGQVLGFILIYYKAFCIGLGQVLGFILYWSRVSLGFIQVLCIGIGLACIGVQVLLLVYRQLVLVNRQVVLVNRVCIGAQIACIGIQVVCIGIGLAWSIQVVSIGLQVGLGFIGFYQWQFVLVQGTFAMTLWVGTCTSCWHLTFQQIIKTPLTSLPLENSAGPSEIQENSMDPSENH